MCFLTLTASCLLFLCINVSIWTAPLSSTTRGRSRLSDRHTANYPTLFTLYFNLTALSHAVKKKRCIKTAALVICLCSARPTFQKHPHIPQMSPMFPRSPLCSKLSSFQICPNMWTLAWTITFQKMSLLSQTPSSTTWWQYSSPAQLWDQLVRRSHHLCFIMRLWQYKIILCGHWKRGNVIFLQ